MNSNTLVSITAFINLFSRYTHSMFALYWIKDKKCLKSITIPYSCTNSWMHAK